AHLRHPPARRRRRPAGHPEAARPRRALDHAALHPRVDRPPDEGLRRRAPPGAARERRGAAAMNGSARARDAGARLCRSVLGASVWARGAAVLAAAWARAAAGEGRGSAGVSIYLADLGLIAPVAVATGLAAGVAALVADPAAPPSPASLAAALR